MRGEVKLKPRILFILLKAYWEGEISRKEVVDAFCISQIQSSKDFAEIKKKYPMALQYDGSKRRYVPDIKIKQYLPENSFYSYQEKVKIGSNSELINVTPSIPNIEPETYRLLHKAIDKNMGLEFEYHSINSASKNTKRTVYPHSIVNSGHRLHIRAFEVSSGNFKDFNIPRIEPSTIKLVEDSNILSRKELDKEWTEKITVFLIPNPVHIQEQKEIIEMDFNMVNSSLRISVRKALMLYTLHSFQVMDFSEKPPKYQLLAIGNREILNTGRSDSNF